MKHSLLYIVLSFAKSTATFAVIMLIVGLLHPSSTPLLARGIPVTGRPADRSYIENKGQICDQDGKPNRDVKYLIVRPGLNIQLRTNGFAYDSYVFDRCGLSTANDDRTFGKVVATVPARSTVSNARFNLSSLSAGIYTVILRAGGRSIHQSMVVIP